MRCVFKGGRITNLSVSVTLFHLSYSYLIPNNILKSNMSREVKGENYCILIRSSH